MAGSLAPEHAFRMGSAPSSLEKPATKALGELAAKTGVASASLLEMAAAELEPLIEQAGITEEAIRQRAKELGVEAKDDAGKGDVVVAILERAKEDGEKEEEKEVEALPKAASAPAALGAEKEEKGGHSSGSVVADAARYPMHLMPCDRLHELERLPSHEEALTRGLLARVEFAEETPGTPSWEFCRVIPIGADGKDGEPLVPSKGFGHGPGSDLFRIDCFHFTSHRWDTPDMDPSKAHPDDPENQKLAHMKEIFPKTPREFVWMDFFCVPQADRKRQQDAISSLPFYVKHCGTFNALVRDHDSLVEYLMRVWCEVELLTTLGPVQSPTWQPKLSTQDKYFLVRPSKKFPSGVSIKITHDWALNPLAGMVTNVADLEGLKPLVLSQIAQLEDWLEADGNEIGEKLGQPVGRYGFFLGGAFGDPALERQVRGAVQALKAERNVVSQRRLVARRVVGILEKSEAEPLKRTKWPKSASALDAAAAAATAPLLTPRGEAKALFRQMDTNGDGQLSSSEMHSRLSDHGLADEQIEQLFLRMDLNGDGFVDMWEWEECWKEGVSAATVGLA